MNSEVIGRKDILFVTLMGFLIFYFDKIKENLKIVTLVIILYIVCLSHSAFFFYSQYLVCFYFVYKLSVNQKILYKEILFLFINLFLIFLLIIFFPGNEKKVFLICESIKEFVSQPCAARGDRIWWLGKSASFHAGDNLRNGIFMFLQSTIVYLISFILVFFFIFKKLYGARFLTQNKIFNSFSPLLVITFLFILSLPVFVLAIDWGRYISISYTSTFFIYIYFIKKNIIKFKKKINFLEFKSLKTFMIFLLIYSFSWTFPFYQATNFKFTLKKPINSFVKIINKN